MFLGDRPRWSSLSCFLARRYRWFQDSSSSTVSKLGSVFGYVTPSPPAVSTRDSDGDVVLRKVCQRFFQSSALQRLALLKIFSIQSSSEWDTSHSQTAVLSPQLRLELETASYPSKRLAKHRCIPPCYIRTLWLPWQTRSWYRPAFTLSQNYASRLPRPSFPRVTFELLAWGCDWDSSAEIARSSVLFHFVDHRMNDHGLNNRDSS